MANKERLSNIIEERNRLIKHYREKCEGLEEVNTLIKTVLFFLLCKNGETKIQKSELSAALGKYTLKFRMDDSNYFVSAEATDCHGDTDSGEANEEKQI